MKITIEGDEIVVRFSAKAEGGKASSSGKMILTASSGGWMAIPETGIRMNLMAGYNA